MPFKSSLQRFDEKGVKYYFPSLLLLLLSPHTLDPLDGVSRNKLEQNACVSPVCQLVENKGREYTLGAVVCMYHHHHQQHHLFLSILRVLQCMTSCCGHHQQSSLSGWSACHYHHRLRSLTLVGRTGLSMNVRRASAGGGSVFSLLFRSLTPATFTHIFSCSMTLDFNHSLTYHFIVY